MEKPTPTSYQQYPERNFGVQFPQNPHNVPQVERRAGISISSTIHALSGIKRYVMGMLAGGVLAAGSGAFLGIVAGLEEAKPIQQTTQVDVEVDVAPHIISTAALDKKTFIRFGIGIAATAGLKDTWSTTLLDQKISWDGVTTSSYNWRLKQAKEEGKPLNFAAADQIIIEGSFGPGIDATYDPDAKPWAERKTAEEKAQPTIIEVIVGAEDISFTPIVNPNPFTFAEALKTEHDFITLSMGVPSSATAAFGGSEPAYKDTKKTLAEAFVYRASVSLAMDTCGTTMINSPKLKPISLAAIQSLLAKDANKYRVPGQPKLTPNDITVKLESIKPNYKSDWTKEFNDIIAAKKKAAQAAGGDFSFNEPVIDGQSGCEIAETDLETLNKGGR